MGVGVRREQDRPYLVLSGARSLSYGDWMERCGPGMRLGRGAGEGRRSCVCRALCLGSGAWDGIADGLPAPTSCWVFSPHGSLRQPVLVPSSHPTPDKSLLVLESWCA